ncbi:MAG: PEP-CTERM sorting domain-containing protein [Verrucomicrobiales bacterium]
MNRASSSFSACDPAHNFAKYSTRLVNSGELISIFLTTKLTASPSMKKTIFSLAAIACALQIPSASAALIAGSDFSDAAVFNEAGGTLDNATDDLNLSDNITVTNWVNNPSGGNLAGGLDNNAQVGMPNDIVTKINGDDADTSEAPVIGADSSSFWGVSFSIEIPAGTQVDLTSVTFDWRKATGSANVRWIGFDTSLDSGLLYSQNGQIRPNVDSADIDLSGALYQGLTDQTVTFNWYAGGQGSGDVDFDTVIVNGTVSPIPEPSGFALLGLAGLAAIMRRRR